MAYTLFRHHRMADFLCAIPQDWPVPSFIVGPTWTYAATTAPGVPRPLGFNDDAARYSCQLQGFYTFHECPPGQMLRDGLAGLEQQQDPAVL
jgi:hypothetical protein